MEKFGLLIDDSTGLPKLPDGYFWRVCSPSIPEIQIRKKTWFGRSSLVSWDYLPGRVFNDKDVRNAAVSLFQWTWTTKNNLFGDYPPNKIRKL